MSSKPCQVVAIVALLILLLDGAFCLSASGRSSLTEAFRGINLEERLERLRNLRVVGLDNSATSKAKPVSTDETGSAEVKPFPGGGSILEKNRLEGVDEYLFEGDINLTEEQLSALEANLDKRATRQKRQASKDAPLWENKKVFYYFDPSINEAMKDLVKKATSYISARTCITFVENATAENRIRVFSGSGCYSNIGMTGGEQDLSLEPGCNTVRHKRTVSCTRQCEVPLHCGIPTDFIPRPRLTQLSLQMQW
ncbi:astacin [Teladorsagia circumcincta]|uniref:Astacin n=1 Tax=Teladorsagia circumcincta TaxID=45464 RepID=A0A2G9UG60_TELCI|nr:astacin [Teladorsagia circumcincta]